MGDVEVRPAAARHDAHANLPMQRPQHFFRPIDDPRMRSQQLGVNAVPLGPQPGNLGGRDSILDGQGKRAFASA
jgi:hypothetical protein